MKPFLTSLLVLLSLLAWCTSAGRAQATGPEAVCPYPDTTLYLCDPSAGVTLCQLVSRVIANGFEDASTHGCYVESGPANILVHSRCATFHVPGTYVIVCDAYVVDAPEIPADTCKFTVTVVDASTFACPADIEVSTGGSQDPVVVTWPQIGNPPPVCVPPSGSSFPVGTTTVTCTAGDGGCLTCSFTVTVLPSVPFDIRPGSCPNPLNTAERGVLPAAILGTSSFNVDQIDPSTVRLEGVAPVRSSLQDVAAPFSPYTGKDDCMDCTKQKKDKLPDLVVSFNAQEIIAALGTTTPGECRVLHMTAALKGGGSIIGEDVVRIHTSIGKESALDLAPETFALYSNYPNPFNPTTMIRYSLPQRSHVRLVIYNTLGQTVADLVNGEMDAGYHEVQFNAANLASGVYFCKMQAGDFVETNELLLMK